MPATRPQRQPKLRFARGATRSLLTTIASVRRCCSRKKQHLARREDPRAAIQLPGCPATAGTSVIDYVNQQFDRSATWADVAWLRERWRGTLAIKGLMMPDDCAQAVAIGADAIMVSNHGGRQLDGAAAPIDQIAAIRDRIDRAAQLICDGGIRRGTHILKAIALGADACSIGRPYLYGLAAAGEQGVARVLALLCAEVERGMALIGRTSVADLSASDVRKLISLDYERCALSSR